MTDTTTVLLLTKIAPLFVFPLGFALMLAVLGLASALMGRRRTAGGFLAVAVAVLWAASTPAVADWAALTLERQYPPKPVSELPKSDVVIVLGGAIIPAIAPRIVSDLQSSADRVLHAARIYKAGKAERVLITGGNLPWQAEAAPEARAIRDLLVEWGVPGHAISVAGASRNTYENALEIQGLREQRPFRTALLVTSAMHMPRSVAIFEKAGIPIIPAATDFEVADPGPWTPLRWLPSADALLLSTRAIKEWIGLVAYRLRGYA